MGPYFDKTHHKKRAGRVAQGVGSEYIIISLLTYCVFMFKTGLL
jgi:hypothetical protein